jgi:hypothetical protein
VKTKTSLVNWFSVFLALIEIGISVTPKTRLCRSFLNKIGQQE